MATSYGNPPIVTDGLVLCLDAANPLSYPGSGTTWNDLSGQGNSGTLINGPTFNSSNGGSLVFDGADDYARFNSGLYGRISFSLEYWFYQNSIESFSQEMFTSDYTNSGNTSNPGIEIYSSGTTLYFRSNYNNGTRPATTTISAQVWNHVVAVCTVDSSITLYLNGVEGNSNIPSNPYITWNNEPLNLGAITGYSILIPFSGKISIGKIYNRALSASEVLQNYEATKTRFGL
jgi:hypothetical protein